LKNKKFILVTQYFPPEIGGGSQRSIGFAEELKNQGFDVEVITPFPSYLISKENIKIKFRLFEKTEFNGIVVYRTFVIASDRGNFLKRICYYLSFTLSALLIILFHLNKFDFIMTISPPLFTGMAGVLAKKLRGGRFIFDIGDLWPESAVQLGFLKNKYAIYLAVVIEKWIYKNSDHINVVTRLTSDKLKKQFFFIKNIHYVPNFVDTSKITKQKKDIDYLRKFNLDNKVIFGYAGNIGSAQGLRIISDAALKLKDIKNAVFLIIGAGVEKNLIEEDIVKNKLSNVLLIPPISRDEIIRLISIFDYMIIPLVKNDLFRITIPSKLYESMAAEIPVILCVDGEARRILEKYNCGIYVEPENSQMLSEILLTIMNEPGKFIQLGVNGRLGALQEFDRKNIISKFIQSINE
jgi:glycosyltransferase involved in cell wall biosynthesis